MSGISLNGGNNFRVINNEGKDLTTESSINSKNVKIQIDIDKDGKFDGQNDLTISDTKDLDAIFDTVKGNANKSIPFVDEIETHIINNKGVNDLLKVAETQGEKSKKESIFSSKKIEYGKEAFQATQKAYSLDKNNTNARIAYGSALLGINQSTFKNIASSKLGIDLNKLTNDFIQDISKDKNDIKSKLLLKTLCNVTSNPKEIDITKDLLELKKNFPKEYSEAEKEIKETLSKI